MAEIPPKTRDTKNLTQALLKAQKSFPTIEPDAKNPYFNSTYSSLAGIIRLTTPVLAANGLAFSQVFELQEDGSIALVTLLRHVGGEWLESRLPINAKVDVRDKHGMLLFVKENSQTLGSAISYARRYSLMSILGIATSICDDDGNAASHQSAATDDIQF